MNSGIRDAFNLGWKLAAVIQGSFDKGLLDTYFEERAPHARELIQLAVRMGQIMMPRSRFHAWLTQTGFRLMRFAPAIQGYFAQMRYKPKPYYRRGFIAQRHPDRLAGRMLAQPIVEKLDGQQVPLDQLLGSFGFSLVAFGPDAEQRLADSLTTNLPFPDVRRIAILPSIFNARRPPIRGIEVVRDLYGALSHLASAGATVLMLVRPDRYIAAATSEVSGEFVSMLHRLVTRSVELEDTPNLKPSHAQALLASRRQMVRSSAKLTSLL
jgi:3-(3-hydroxy-phenyl)propionate hydroxylase